MQLASSTGDISTVLRMLSMSAALTPADYIKKTVGQLRFLYYSYVKQLGVRPLDLEDMIDGLLYLDANNYAQEREIQKRRGDVKHGPK